MRSLEDTRFRLHRGRRLAMGATLIAVTAATLVVVSPGDRASADTQSSADSIGWYRPSDASWHMSFDTPPGDESDVAFVNGPTNSGGVTALAGDWDGDGSDSIAWYRNSDASWHFSSDLSGGASDATFSWGPAGDASVVPVVGDWDGDGKDTVGWYRPADASWHLASANNGSADSTAFVWGPAGNTAIRPVVGDWNGSKKDKVGWYRPSDGSWHLAQGNLTSAASTTFVWGPVGNSSIKAVAGDWNGDGRDTIGWYRPSDASWHLAAENSGAAASQAYSWGPAGNASVIPLVGDWDGRTNAGGTAPGWVRPGPGGIVSPYGNRVHPVTGVVTFHEGVDLRAACNTGNYAASAGTVDYAKEYAGYGNYVRIDHGNGIKSAYGHIVDGGIRVSVGQKVTAGQLIGLVGSTGVSTGCHIHFEIRANGAPIDPVKFMAARGVTL
ncbi:M23 family metallopeptidase [Curtobacterium flaccumfaciens]|uniref:M23 family metallopeptidase n=1 Tax=Curtobacterium flaccumfaciens TaxID=2035 RepID=UPI00217CD928|nr:M23 family metallopeptidase [Curtobacterium flaccumfaciens]MCS6588213.1 M23 family metallopeptidase [Curtobacterium flaccumfaciens pv. flaccumfaciens]